MRTRRLHQPTRSPLALAREGSASVSFRALDSAWCLWRPCPDCGGVELPLRHGAGDGGVGPTCPACETRRRRQETTADEPCVWYDTWLEDWVVRLPCGDGSAALIPMEIHWYDAGWAEVYRTAADLRYGDEPD